MKKDEKGKTKLSVKDLRTCRHCGEKPFICKPGYLWHVFCDTPHCEFNGQGLYYPTKQGAIEAWNYTQTGEEVCRKL